MTHKLPSWWLPMNEQSWAFTLLLPVCLLPSSISPLCFTLKSKRYDDEDIAFLIFQRIAKCAFCLNRDYDFVRFEYLKLLWEKCNRNAECTVSSTAYSPQVAGLKKRRKSYERKGRVFSLIKLSNTVKVKMVCYFVIFCRMTKGFKTQFLWQGL